MNCRHRRGASAEAVQPIQPALS